MLARVKHPFKNPLTVIAEGVTIGLGALPTFGGLRTVLWIVFGLLLVAIIYLAQFSNAALLAHSLQTKEAQIDELKRENAQLQYEIAAVTAPSSIEARARKLGLGPARNIVYANLPAFQSDGRVLPGLAFSPAPVMSQALALQSPWDEILAMFGLGGVTNRAQAQSK